MHQEIAQLYPSEMWHQFVALNAVPRPSKKEEKVKQFILEFARKNELEALEDGVGNIIVKKPASKGMEDKKTVVLQSHLDMVHQKNAETEFDFDTQGIQMEVKGDWVRAKGTTLGADNGIGVASIMAILESNEIVHPAIEALFTIDEETGMTGALGLKGGLLTGEILLNLDTEEDTEITIGCAGGVDVTGSGNYTPEALNDAGYDFYTLKIKGLSGGHSGMDIHLGLGNANQLMNRLLFNLCNGHVIRIHKIVGGGLRNAIPRESSAIFAVKKENSSALNKDVQNIIQAIRIEYASTDPQLSITIEAEESVETVFPISFQEQFLSVLYSVHNGIKRLSPTIEGMVHTSNNLAKVWVESGKYTIQCLTRSASDSEKYDLATQLKATMSMLPDASISFAGDYPGWTPKPDAEIIQLMTTLYKEKRGSHPHVTACHAGLECGILGTNYPDMEMVSFGPNIRGAHSPDERVQISSIQKYWDLLVSVLAAIPEK